MINFLMSIEGNPNFCLLNKLGVLEVQALEIMLSEIIKQDNTLNTKQIESFLCSLKEVQDKFFETMPNAFEI